MTEAEKQAKELLPIPTEWFRGYEAIEEYAIERREFVTIALAEKDAEIERLRAILQAMGNKQ